MSSNARVIFILTCLIVSGISYTMEQELPTNTNANKEDLWNLMEMQVNSWTDALGKPIDPKIKETVIVLNLLGFKTEGSCEGHSNEGYSFPWVSFSIRDDTLESLIKKRNDIIDIIEAQQQKRDVSELNSESSTLSPSVYRRMNKLTDKIGSVSYIKLNPLRDLINKFYTNHTVDDDRMLMLSNFVDYDYWLTSSGAEQQITMDEDTKLKKLKDYQEEIYLFTEFLKDYYWSDLNPLK